MKLSVSQLRMVAAVSLVFLALLAWLALGEVLDSSERLSDAQSDLIELEQKVSDIRRLAKAPKVAALEVESADAIVNRINAALRGAGLPENTLSSQAPSEPRRIGQTDFKLRRVTIILRHAPLAKIVAFCDFLRDEETGSVVRDLNLSQPQGQGKREQWRSQMTLTQMIFSPKSES